MVIHRVVRHGTDEILVRTLVREAEPSEVLTAYRMESGTRELLTQQQAWECRQDYPGFNEPPYQLRLCPLGAWTLAIEEGTSIGLLPWPAGRQAPSFAPATSVLTVEWTINTGITMNYRSGVPDDPRSWYGDVLGETGGYLSEVAARVGIALSEPHSDDHARLLAAVADDLKIPSIPIEVLDGPLLTVTRYTAML